MDRRRIRELLRQAEEDAETAQGEAEEREPWPTQLLGWVVACTIAGGLILGLTLVNNVANARFERLEALAGGPLANDNDLWPLAPFALIFLAPTVAGAFGWKPPRWLDRHGGLLPNMPRHRWKVAAAYAAVSALALGLCAWGAGASGHYYTAAEAVWYRNSRPVARHVIADAEYATLRCEMNGGYRRADLPLLTFKIHFADDRDIESEVFGDDADEVAGWLDEAEPVMDTLRRAHADRAKPRLRVYLGQTCHAAVRTVLDPAQSARIDRLFAPVT